MIIFLQNAWSPVYAGGVWPRESWMRALTRSRSGQKVRLLTDDFSRIYNITPECGATPSSVLPANEGHVSSILSAYAPRVVVACGQHAEAALRKLWSGPMLVLPHPAARVLTTALYIQARGLLDEPGFFGRWALRQKKDCVQLEPLL